MAFSLTDSKANEMLPFAHNKSGKEVNNMLGKADFYPKIEYAVAYIDVRSYDHHDS